MADKYDEIRKRMILYRQSRELVQEEVAATLGISQSRFCKGETGHESITNDYLTALHKIGWDIDYIVTGEKWKRKRRTLRDSLEDFNDENEIFDIIHWALSTLYKNSSVNKVYSLEQNLLKFMCHNVDITVFEAIRHVNNMSQIEYADALHLTIRKCRSLEKGVTYPSADLLGDMYERLGCRPTLLLDIGDIKWNLLENIWNHIPVKDEKIFLDFVNDAIRYQKKVGK